jgi:DNA anti-recombination protein RmuC
MLSAEASMTSFDAHQYAKRLIAAGASPDEADVHAEALTHVTGEVATLGKRVDAQFCKAESTGTCLAGQVAQAHAAQDTKLAELSEKISNVYAELSEKISTVHTELSEKISNVHTELSEKISNVHAELSEKMNQRFTEQDKKIAELSEQIVKSKLETIRWTIGIVLTVASLQSGVIAAMLHWMR